MSSTDQKENDFLRKYCATESDICQGGGIPKPKKAFNSNASRAYESPDLIHRMEN